MLDIKEIAHKELEYRNELVLQIKDIVEKEYEPGKGYVFRGAFQNYIYNELGFHGTCGVLFAKFMNKVMQELGYRMSMNNGNNVYYGLKKKIG